jgi:hypothetical protein
MTLAKTRTYIIEVSFPYVETFEDMIRMNDHMCKIAGHTDSVNLLDKLDTPIPTNYGTWDENGKFHGGTNYSGEATRYALTIESKGK